MRRIKKTWVLVLLLLAVILGLGIYKYHNYRKLQLANQEALANEADYDLISKVDIDVVKKGDFFQTVNFIGNLQAAHQANISSQINATVEKVFVHQGELVKKNQLLANLDSATLLNQVRNSQASLQTSTVQFQLAKDKFNKQQQLYQDGFLSYFDYQQLKDNYEAARNQLSSAKVALKEAELKLSYSQIKAPFDGYIYQKNISEGDLVAEGSVLFSIANLNDLEIQTSISGSQINQVKLGQTAYFNTYGGADARDKEEAVLALAQDQNMSQLVQTGLEGKVTYITPVASSSTNSYAVFITISNGGEKLLANQFVSGNLITGVLKGVSYLSSLTLRQDVDSGKPYVLVLNTVKQRIRRKEVTVLARNDSLNLVAVTGLQEGEIVLLNNVLSVSEGDKAKMFLSK